MTSDAITIDLVAEMRGWCEDVFSDMPDDATDEKILAAVARCYEGGIAAFVADSQ